MRRGEVWTVSAGGHAGKPRPALIVQNDRFDATASIAICIFTTSAVEAPHLRLSVGPSTDNGLATPSRLMIDKLVTVPRDKLGRRIGRLANDDMQRVDRALAVFVGLA